MFPKTAQDALNDALLQQLERIPGVTAGLVHSPVDPPILPLAGSISFNGPSHGRIEIVASREFTLLLARHSIGGLPQNQEDANDRADVCLKELAQRLGEALLPHLANGNVAQYRWSRPVMRSVDIECDWPNLAASRDTHLFHANGHILAARLVELE